MNTPHQEKQIQMKKDPKKTTPQNFVFLSGEANPLSVVAEDRRYLVVAKRGKSPKKRRA